jgi:MFS family permease
MLRLATFQAALAATLLLVLLSLIPGLAARHLGLAVEDSSYLLLPGGVGFVLGSVAMGRFGERWNRTRWIGVGMTGMGIGLGLMSLSGIGADGPDTARPPLAGIALFEALILGLGSMLALVIIPARTVLQERPPEEMRGRVIAAQLALGNAGAVVPLFLGGAMADSMGMAPVMGLMAAVAVGAGLAGLIRGRHHQTR